MHTEIDPILGLIFREKVFSWMNPTNSARFFSNFEYLCQCTCLQFCRKLCVYAWRCKWFLSISSQKGEGGSGGRIEVDFSVLVYIILMYWSGFGLRTPGGGGLDWLGKIGRAGRSRMAETPPPPGGMGSGLPDLQCKNSMEIFEKW
jgi:hypothetical protein